ncbi:MAG: Hpt domain-containing protein, partial [Chloroflexi bacterium]|nr:Hpt domain-containing protein [Chloroflexota bacterium]
MAREDEDIKSRLLRTFQGEAQEHLGAISANLASLERGLSVAESTEVVEATFRAIHTLKGAARSVSLLEVEGLCQACESVFSRVRRGELALTGGAIHAVQHAMDAAARLIEGGEVPERQSLIDRLDAVAGASSVVADTREPAAAPPVAPLAADVRRIESIRLATAELDALFVRAEDLLVPKLA